MYDVRASIYKGLQRRATFYYPIWRGEAPRIVSAFMETSYAGEIAVPGVSLVIQFNTIFIYLFTALAIYNSGAAVYRSLGKTNVTMYISVLSNIINVVGIVIGVFVFDA